MYVSCSIWHLRLDSCGSSAKMSGPAKEVGVPTVETVRYSIGLGVFETVHLHFHPIVKEQ